jgi:YVTN family beta-propeller protein
MSPPIAVPASPAGMAVSPDGTRLYVSNDAVGPVTGSVSVINVATLAVIDTIPVGHLPRAIAFTPDGSVAYVTNRQDGTVTPIETRSDTTGNPIAVDAGPLALAISDDGATVYVANGNSSTVSVIDTASGAVSTIEQLPAPFDLALGPCPGHPQVCAGDCNGDGTVGINELIIGVNIALGTQPASACTAVDVDGNGMVTINELVRAVSSALNGCTA